MGLYLSVQVLSRLWLHAKWEVIHAVSAASAEAFQHYGMTTVPEIVDFMAECSEETGGGIAFVESGAYSAERAHQVWPSLFPTVQSAQIVVGNPKALFDKTYGGRLGNIPGTDDGYNFRGRGLIQITGRTWYEQIAKATGLDLVVDPDQAADPQHLLECALAFWKIDGVNKLVGDIRAEVKRINGGYTNMAAREAWEATCKRLITAETTNLPPIAPIPVETPPPKPPIVLHPASTPDSPKGAAILHPTFADEFAEFLARWL